MYLPYSFVFGGSAIQLIETIILTSTMSTLYTSGAVSRLLSTLTTDHYLSVFALLATSLAINYLMNIIYVFIFMKYMRPLLSQQQQIDRISNFLVLFIATVTNYRFGLIAYSKIFPKPQIPIDSHIRLTPVHYLCIASILLQIFPLAACCLLIYKQYPLTDPFMLAIDILVVTILNIGFSLWFVSVSKPDQYYDHGTKKYTTQDSLYHTEEGIIGNSDFPDKNISKAHLNHMGTNDQREFNQDVFDNQQQNLNDYKKIAYAVKSNNRTLGSDGENMPLPLKISALNVVPVKINSTDQSFYVKQESIDFQLNKHNRSPNQIKNKTARKGQLSDEQALKLRKQEQANNFSKQSVDKNRHNNNNSKQKSNDIASKSKSNQNQQSHMKIKKQKKVNDSLMRSKMKDEQIETSQVEIQGQQDYSHNNKALRRNEKITSGRQRSNEKNDEHSNRYNSDTLEELALDRSKKLNHIKSQTHRKQNSPRNIFMKKSKKIGLFQSQAGQSSNIEELDLEAIIQRKVVNYQNNNDNHFSETTKTQGPNFSDDNQVNEDISPSWFNIQNQRFDLSDDASNNNESDNL